VPRLGLPLSQLSSRGEPPAPVPECSTGVSTACWQNQVVAGDPTGYETAPLPAGAYGDAGLDPGTPETGAFCVVSTTPIAGCPSTGTYTICLGSTLVQCNAGWATAETPCPGECHAYGGAWPSSSPR
jgi:hypothetical protein